MPYPLLLTIVMAILDLLPVGGSLITGVVASTWDRTSPSNPSSTTAWLVASGLRHPCLLACPGRRSRWCGAVQAVFRLDQYASAGVVHRYWETVSRAFPQSDKSAASSRRLPGQASGQVNLGSRFANSTRQRPGVHRKKGPD